MRQEQHAANSGDGSAVTCPLCSAETHQTLATRGRANEDLHTVICTSCGLVFTSPIPTAEEVAEYYAKDYRLTYKGVAQPKKKHVYRAGRRALGRLPLVQELVSPGATVIDVGSGGGEFVYLLQRLGYDVSGIEPDEGYGGYAIQEYGVNIQIGPFDAEMIAPQSVELVTANHVVEHLRDPLTVFNGVHRGLRPGGFFVVEVPNVEALYHAPSNKWHFAHIFNFNPETMENMGRKAGFDVLRTDLVGSCQHVRTIFQKGETTQPVRTTRENYQRVKALLDGYQDWNHYTSLMPAKRLWSSVSQVIHEKLAVDTKLTGKEILDRLYSAAETRHNLRHRRAA